MALTVLVVLYLRHMDRDDSTALWERGHRDFGKGCVDQVRVSYADAVLPMPCHTGQVRGRVVEAKDVDRVLSHDLHRCLYRHVAPSDEGNGLSLEATSALRLVAPRRVDFPKHVDSREPSSPFVGQISGVRLLVEQ